MSYMDEDILSSVNLTNQKKKFEHLSLRITMLHTKEGGSF